MDELLVCIHIKLKGSAKDKRMKAYGKINETASVMQYERNYMYRYE